MKSSERLLTADDLFGNIVRIGITYDTADFVAECRNLKVTPHVAQDLERPGGRNLAMQAT
jgi:hypothetical protein